jgi:cytochrome c oxidase subunit IIa family protein
MPGSEVDTIDDTLPEDLRPRGTLAIIAVFGVLFALSWLGAYFLVFLERGTPQP